MLAGEAWPMSYNDYRVRIPRDARLAGRVLQLVGFCLISGGVSIGLIGLMVVGAGLFAATTWSVREVAAMLAGAAYLAGALWYVPRVSSGVTAMLVVGLGAAAVLLAMDARGGEAVMLLACGFGSSILSLWIGPKCVHAASNILCPWRWQARAVAAGHCPGCGHSIRGLNRPICPECGTTWLINAIEESDAPGA